VSRARAAAITISAVALTGVLAACGSDDAVSPSSPSSAAASAMPSMSGTMAGEHNEQDATFASDMIVHHRGAIEMAKLASSRAADPTVVTLAERIEAAQQPEITTMSAWLRSWGMAMPGDMAGMHDSMPGMTSQADLAKLQAARGPDFDDMFLAMMIKHHEGAVTMAQAEVSGGSNTEAKSLAQKVIEDQTAEIAEMRKMLG
jgi:uncharacterized protein (DUF305 family)